MSRVIDAVTRHAAAFPDHIALEGEHASLSYGRLPAAIAYLAGRLRRAGGVAILADNGPACAVADLACVAADIPCVPIPPFFSPAQVRHLLQATGADTVLTDAPERIETLLESFGLPHVRQDDWEHAGMRLQIFGIEGARPGIPDGIAKVTFTSGTTGEPKGVCLEQRSMERVAASLAEASGAGPADRHLSLLPYAALLENIGGLYAGLLVGATVCMPGLESIGMRGAAGLDAEEFARAFTRFRATTCILTPQMLLVLVLATVRGLRPDTLRFIAVGGAPVSLHLLAQAERLGLPVYEGYGLSEAASVVAVNRPGVSKLGSVGRPLKHVRLRFADDGEIEVAGNLFAGYLHEEHAGTGEFWPTGDTGYLDDEGFLHLTGRKKHIFITAFGRNIAPEWVERELIVTGSIAQAAVFGEAAPFNVAVLVPRGGADNGAIAKAVSEANARLPDYARIGRWLIAEESFSLANGQWTGTGRPRRESIWGSYAGRIRALYVQEASDVVL